MDLYTPSFATANESRFPLTEGLYGPQCRSERFEDQKNFLNFTGIRTQDRAARSLVTLLSRLLVDVAGFEIELVASRASESLVESFRVWI